MATNWPPVTPNGTLWCISNIYSETNFKKLDLSKMELALALNSLNGLFTLWSPKLNELEYAVFFLKM